MQLSRDLLIGYIAGPALLCGLAFLTFNGAFFYNGAGFASPVRTIFGEERSSTMWAMRHSGSAVQQPGKPLSVPSVLSEALAIDDTSDNGSPGATIEA